ncbi:MAG: glycosyltransferase [Patescibacteria group bacterium]
MKVSVLIIAHNESEHIASCIESLLKQTCKPDEIVVVNHNSTDATGEIARRHPVTVLDHQGPRGSVYARIHGLESVSSDAILCIDGDAVAASDWVEVMTNLLEQEGMAMVGSWIRMRGTWYAALGSLWWHFTCPSRGYKATDYLWGASFGIPRSQREFAIRALEKGRELSERLSLAYNPDDYWLALYLHERGKLEVTNKTWVLAHAKETTNWQSFIRGVTAAGIRMKMQRFIRENGLPKIA